MKLIFLGPPGVGKGTQAALLSEKYDIPQISTGEVLRQAVENKDELGLIAQKYMDKGELVPDDVVIGIVKNKAVNLPNGFILDGFPRTIAQAEALDEMLESFGYSIDAVIQIVAEDEVLVERLSGRMTCKECGRNYHIVNMPPKKAGICDECGGELIIRDDDRPGSIRNRIKVYNEKTTPLVSYYENSGKLVQIGGDGSIEKIYKNIIDVLRTLNLKG